MELNFHLGVQYIQTGNSCSHPKCPAQQKDWLVPKSFLRSRQSSPSSVKWLFTNTTPFMPLRALSDKAHGRHSQTGEGMYTQDPFMTICTTTDTAVATIANAVQEGTSYTSSESSEKRSNRSCRSHQACHHIRYNERQNRCEISRHLDPKASMSHNYFRKEYLQNRSVMYRCQSHSSSKHSTNGTRYMIHQWDLLPKPICS